MPFGQRQYPALTEAEKADTQGFMNEILRILPVVGLRAFELPKPVAVPAAAAPGTSSRTGSDGPDTVIVPAQKEGFERVFLGEDCCRRCEFGDGSSHRLGWWDYLHETEGKKLPT